MLRGVACQVAPGFVGHVRHVHGGTTGDQRLVGLPELATPFDRDGLQLFETTPADRVDRLVDALDRRLLGHGQG